MFVKTPHLVFAILVTASSLSHAGAPLAAPNWNHAEAASAASEVDHDSALRPLFNLARQKNNTALLSQMQSIVENDAWPIPARESILKQFATGMGDLAPWGGGFEVLEYLAAYPSRVQVPHDDHPAYGVPMFNVRGAAAGSISRWNQYLTAGRAEQKLLDGAGAWSEAFQAADERQRRLYLEALNSASHPQLQEIGAWALAGSESDPSLGVAAAHTAILLSDPELFGRALVSARGPGIAVALQRGNGYFDDIQAESVLRYAMDHATAENASLAMAVLAPRLMQYPDITELMFQAMDHRDLGSTAALLLSRSRDAAVRQRLDELAQDDKGLAGKRASLALETAFTANGGAEK